MLQTPAHSLRPDLARASARKFPDARFVLYPKENTNDAALVGEASRAAESIVIVPESGAEVSKRRPELVESFRKCGFVPDYDSDLTDVDSSAIRLVRQDSDRVSVSSVEGAIARLHRRMRGLERALRTRMSELEMADRHIARLEEKLLSLKEAKKQLRQLKGEKQALRKSPERKVGQVLLAPYLLPQKLFREVRKRKQRSANHAPRPGVVRATEYQAWFDRHRATAAELEVMRAEAQTFPYAPVISIITPVFNTPPAWLEAAIASVRQQAYQNWELMLIDDGSTNEETLRALASAEGVDARVRLSRLKKTSGISIASNQGIESASGDWIGLLDHDDLLEPDALFQTAKLLQQQPDADLIYSDEDKLTEIGLDAPLLKPDWSPDFFLSCNYVSHFTTIRRSLVRELGGFRPRYDFAQDYDLYLRVMSRAGHIHHIPRVLYHWRSSAGSTAANIRYKPQSLDAARNALSDYLARRGEEAHVAVDWRTHAFRIRREIVDEKRIVILIPTRDRIDFLARCIASVEEKTTYNNYEIVVVNNDSRSKEARDYFARSRHRLLHFSGPFNYSALNNFAVEQTDAPWILFLNNDIEVMEGEWLSAMVEHVQRPEVGAVGARLLYPDGSIQHAGVVLGVDGIAGHAFRGFGGEDPGVGRQLQMTRNCSSVTGACLLTRREVFDEIGGFDEERLPVTYNDVDLCLKMRRAGYLIVYTPFAKLYHHESATRRRSVEPRETDVMRARWQDLLARDPYYNPNLSRERADFSLGNQLFRDHSR